MFFDIFKRNKNHADRSEEMTQSDLKWNKMWEMWSNGNIDSPYDELMNYHGEVYNGGHYQYFLNTENNGDVQNEMSALESVLPSRLYNNLRVAFGAYLELERDENADQNEMILRKCDEFFYENEDEINGILRNYSEQL